MELNITREDIGISVLDNNPDMLGNKIRLREISLSNLLSHVKNIPFHVDDVVTKSENENSFNFAPSPNTSILHEEKVKTNYTVVEQVDGRCILTGCKPINVKESMLNNIIKHGITTTTSSELTQSFDQIADERNSIFDVKKAAENAQEAMKNSENELSRVSIEDTETQKLLEMALERQKELSSQIASALKDQSAILEKMRKQYETIIYESDVKREENQKKIIQFQEKILKTKKQVTEIEEDNAKKQELLNALTQSTDVEQFLSQYEKQPDLYSQFIK